MTHIKRSVVAFVTGCILLLGLIAYSGPAILFKIEACLSDIPQAQDVLEQRRREQAGLGVLVGLGDALVSSPSYDAKQVLLQQFIKEANSPALELFQADWGPIADAVRLIKDVAQSDELPRGALNGWLEVRMQLLSLRDLQHVTSLERLHQKLQSIYDYVLRMVIVASVFVMLSFGAGIVWVRKSGGNLTTVLHAPLKKIGRSNEPASINAEQHLVKNKAIGKQDFSEKVLIVDDNELSAMAMYTVVSSQGYSVEFVLSASDALELCRSEEFDVIITDLTMPEIDGYSLTRSLQQLYKGGRMPAVLGVSAHPPELVVHKCMAVGMNGYTQKPLSGAFIQGQFRHLVEGQDVYPVLQSQQTTSSAAKLQTLHVQRILHEFQIGEVEFQGLLRLFRESSPNIIWSLHLAMEKLDFDALARLAHSLKGECKNIGAEKAVAAASKLESEAMKDDAEACAEALSELVAKVEEVLDYKIN